MVDYITKRKICQIYFANSDKQRSDWVCKYFVSTYDKYAALIGLENASGMFSINMLKKYPSI